MASQINASNSGFGGIVSTGDSSGVLQLQTAGTTAVTIDTSQNVLIGSTTFDNGGFSGSANGLNVVDATHPIILTKESTTGVKAFLANTSTQAYLWTPNSIPFTFGTNDTERMRIDSSGNLCVGVASSYLTSRISVESANTNNSRIVGNIYNSAATSTTRGANTLVRIASNATNADACLQLTDNTNNNYYYGGNNGGAYVFCNTGGVRLSNGATSWASDSDERLKDIIEPIENAIEKVSSLRTVIGKYKTDEEGTRRSFLIAQDVQAVLPEAVVEQEDEIGTLSLAYTETIPLLVAAIKEQQTIINDLKARIETLEAK